MHQPEAAFFRFPACLSTRQTKRESVGHRTTDLDSQLGIIFASAACGLGTGTLTQATNGALTYQAPGDGSAGASVTIEDGETHKVFSEDQTKYLVIARNGTDDLSGDAAKVVTDGIMSANEELPAVRDSIAATMKAIGAGMGDERIQRETLSNLQKREQTLLRRKAGEDEAAGVATGSPSISFPDFSNT